MTTGAARTVLDGLAMTTGAAGTVLDGLAMTTGAAGTAPAGRLISWVRTMPESTISSGGTNGSGTPGGGGRVFMPQWNIRLVRALPLVGGAVGSSRMVMNSPDSTACSLCAVV